MKIAIVDVNIKDLNLLSDEICSHYFPEQDIFIYKFNTNQEFMDLLFANVQFKIIFLDTLSSDIVTFKTIQELLPEAVVIGMYEDKSVIPLNNHQLLQKPYTPIVIHNALLHAIKRTSIRPSQLKVMDGSRNRYIPLSKVYYLESYYRKVYVHTQKHSYIASHSLLHQYVDLLSRYGFVSIHKSILINMDKIQSATMDEYVLDNQKILYPSVRKRQEAYKKYQTYSEKKSIL